MIEVIASMQNKFIKKACALKNKKYRDETGLFLLEGIRLVEEAAASSWRIDICMYTAEAAQVPRVNDILGDLAKKQCRIVPINQEILRKVCETEQPQGIIAIVKKEVFDIATIISAGMPLITVLDGIQDPGNAGAIVRVADAAGASGIITLPGCVDLFGGKAVRASMGSIFHLPIIHIDNYSFFLGLMAEKNIKVFATALDAAEVYYENELAQPMAIILGNEGNGVNRQLLSGASSILKIPIIGKAESLNVGQAAAVLLFEVARQRKSCSEKRR